MSALEGCRRRRGWKGSRTFRSLGQVELFVGAQWRTFWQLIRRATRSRIEEHWA